MIRDIIRGLEPYRHILAIFFVYEEIKQKTVKSLRRRELTKSRTLPKILVVSFVYEKVKQKMVKGLLCKELNFFVYEEVE